MKQASMLAAALCCAAMTNDSFSQTAITSGHIDLGIAYEDGALGLHIHDEENEVEYEPGEATLTVGAQSLTLIPGDARYAFLGAAGEPVYVLPQIARPELIFLGIGAEEVEAGLFAQDRLTLTLRGLEGPGQFAGYSADGFGNPTVYFNSRDGIGASDRINVTAGTHADINWAFTAPGTYRLTFEASGVLDGGVSIVSGPVDFNFNVVPEPSAIALFGLGAILLVNFARRRI